MDVGHVRRRPLALGRSQMAAGRGRSDSRGGRGTRIIVVQPLSEADSRLPHDDAVEDRACLHGLRPGRFLVACRHRCGQSGHRALRLRRSRSRPACRERLGNAVTSARGPVNKPTSGRWDLDRTTCCPTACVGLGEPVSCRCAARASARRGVNARPHGQANRHSASFTLANANADRQAKTDANRDPSTNRSAHGHTNACAGAPSPSGRRPLPGRHRGRSQRGVRRRELELLPEPERDLFWT
jgi:hypothetical protein